MVATTDERRTAFAAWTQRVVDDVKLSRGWPATRIADEVGVGRSTLYRWLRGDWSKGEPKPTSVVKFCAGLDIDPAPAFTILGWGTAPGASRPVRRATEPLDDDPDLRAVARKLRDPNVPASEKAHIRVTLQWLATRPPIADQHGQV